MITLYSNDCPKCKLLKKKLAEKEIPYIMSMNFAVLDEEGIMSLPVIAVEEEDGIQYLSFEESMAQLK